MRAVGRLRDHEVVAGEVSAPSGTVTFLFTDIEGSTQRWDREPLAMQAALDAHDRTLRATLAAHGGYVFAVTGDGFGAAFERADDAVFAAASIQSTIGAREWETEGGLRVRIGVHTGSAVEREGNYFGPAVNVAARVMGLALGVATLSETIVFFY